MRDSAVSLDPGELHDLGNDGLLVGTGGGVVSLGDVRAEGKSAMAAQAWARGVRLAPGDRLE